MEKKKKSGNMHCIMAFTKRIKKSYKPNLNFKRPETSQAVHKD